MVTKYYRATLILIGFLTGFVIIAMEISASRLLAPYFGTSIFIWSNIIAVVLLSLAIGYYFGGVLSERHTEYKYLLKIILLAGSIFFLVPWVSNWLGVLLQNASVGHATSLLYSFLFTFILFGLPLMLLAMVSPFLLKLYTIGDTHVGNAAGILSAWSTIGSLLGTFVPTLWLVPTFGTRITLHILAIILVLIGCFGLKKKYILPVVIISVVTFAFTSYPKIYSALSIVYEKETPYSHLRVTKDFEGNTYMQFDQAMGIQSVYNPEKILSGYYYDDLATLAGIISKEKKDVLILGLAGGTSARIIKSVYGDMVSIDGVEIDPTVIEASKKFFGLNKLDINFINQDGRTYLRQTSKKYDYIIVDVYQNESIIPWTLTTKEFWLEVKKHLANSGFVGMNVLSRADSKLLTAITNTQASVFTNTYISEDGENNFLVISSDIPIDFVQLEKKMGVGILGNTAAEISKNITNFIYNPNYLVLTDDKAPIELLSEM
ncbi:MAG: fused MFS/spermidine synthase [Candidatus Pacebacteria bacterium]|nr:fused MFS/spermidine synthase [Candidatus Paceibacterota bacterium]